MKITRCRKRPAHCKSRRNFLRAAAFLGPVAAAFISGGSKPAAAAPRKPTAPDGTRYRETDHIRQYYENL